mmetsp:Transcript_9329/g.18766  ORF Transcript_9329/g.18766 Transcript_9329/m.18766 type:complete len:281 (+) Transcript_9329:60-902(+)
MPSLPHDGRLYQQVVEAWLGPKSVSAGYDTSAIGRMGMEGLVGLNTSASLMNLSRLQATKLRQSVQVLNIRASEAQNVVDFLQDDAPEGAVAYQMHVGPGFGNKKPEASNDNGLLGPLDNIPVDKKSSGVLDALSGGKKGTAEEKKKDLPTDLDGWYIKLALDDVMKFSRRAVRDAAYMQYLTSRGARMVNGAVRSAAEELRYPGFPAEALPTPSVRPPPNRPRNLAPAVLDLQFATARGTDPYKSWPGYEVHNPFGYPPLPPPLPSSSAGGAASTVMSL